MTEWLFISDKREFYNYNKLLCSDHKKIWTVMHSRLTLTLSKSHLLHFTDKHALYIDLYYYYYY